MMASGMRGCRRTDQVARSPAGPGVRSEDVSERQAVGDGSCRQLGEMLVNDTCHSVHDAKERQMPVDERGDALLVGGVEDRGGGSGELPGSAGETDGRERIVVQWEEFPVG